MRRGAGWPGAPYQLLERQPVPDRDEPAPDRDEPVSDRDEPVGLLEGAGGSDGACCRSCREASMAPDQEGQN